VPLDPCYPAERLRYMIGDAAPRVVLTQEHLRERLPATAAELISLDGQWSEIELHACDNLNPTELGVDSEHLAYVIYTSGSTGQPKGVMIEHRHVLNLWQGLETAYHGSTPCQRIALNASLNFDASVQQIVHLLSGRTLFVIPEECRRDATLLIRFFSANRIQGVDCTPSQLTRWISSGFLEDDACPVTMVLVGGEAIESELWNTLANSQKTDFYNVYGPTECTVDSTIALLRCDTSSPHVGHPMDNRRIYILDRHRQPVPIGVAGEIYIGGAGVARGYLNQPELTTERFSKDPFSADADARMYQTGDLGRWRTDGNIEYLGRNDTQVKIRGFRIEPGEIQAQLMQHPKVRHALVLAREDVPGEKRLVAYVVSSEAVDVAQQLARPLREFLKARLPDHMIPSHCLFLEQLPLTPNGKLDRRALPAPESRTEEMGEYIEPRTDLERRLAQIWAQVLQVDRVGLNDNFFELGGHSLLGMKLMTETASSLAFQPPVATIFQYPTVAEMAHLLEEILIRDNLAPQAQRQQPTAPCHEEGII
jgi:amino acid adenylation domain-containing protein